MEDSRESAEQISSYAEERSLFMNKDLKYENYLTQPNSLPFEEAMEIYEAILQNSPEDDEEFNDCLCGPPGKLEADQERSAGQ